MEGYERTEHKSTADAGHLMSVLGGAALIFFGVRLMMSHPGVRRYVKQLGLNDLVRGAIPDFARYLKLKSM